MKKNLAKNLTLTILSLAFIIGCVGSFVPIFNMTGYIDFLKGFAPLYISLIMSIGGNSALKKLQENKK